VPNGCFVNSQNPSDPPVYTPTGAYYWITDPSAQNNLSIVAATEGGGLTAKSIDSGGTETILRLDVTGNVANSPSNLVNAG
jgi:hypothetical protein